MKSRPICAGRKNAGRKACAILPGFLMKIVKDVESRRGS